MNAQTDLFAADETAVRSFPPHLDPARVKDFAVDLEENFDHVAAPVNGILPIGALGNNADVWVAKVLDAAGTVLAAFQFPSSAAAWAHVRTLEKQLAANRQTSLL